MSTTSYKYFTTPIYYANGQAHAGHLYTCFLAQILKNHYTNRGFYTRFLTGLDEHGEAVESKAKEVNKSPQQLVDDMAKAWKSVFEQHDIKYDIFLRTSSKEHVQNVQQILNLCYQKGDIYFGKHKGHYCVKCEGYLNASEMDDNKDCLIHKRPTETREEENYFFKTSKYKEQIRELLMTNKIVHQERYKNELLAMIDSVLSEDLSISRPKSRLTWGIELPFDANHVTYVWFDALPNYVTGIGGVEAAKHSLFWENSHHIIGKDILKFHGLFWPAMCLSLDIPVAKLLVTGWILKDNHKMSKSLGNILGSDDVLKLGKDAFINYVFRYCNPGDDIDFSVENFYLRFNADLANGIGNLSSRVLTMITKYCSNKIPTLQPHSLPQSHRDLLQNLELTVKKVECAFDDFKIADAIQEIWSVLQQTDKLVSCEKPWEFGKDLEANRLKIDNLLATCVSVLKTSAYLLSAFFPEKMQFLLKCIGEDGREPSRYFQAASEIFSIAQGFDVTHVPKLYERCTQPVKLDSLENGDSLSSPTSSAGLPLDEAAAFIAPDIEFAEFQKVQIRIALVLGAELVDKSDKLIKLTVSLGELGNRQIFSGIREYVKLEEVTHKKVLIVSNLKPRKFKFGTSEGMLLTSTGIDTKITPVYVSDCLKEGDLLL